MTDKNLHQDVELDDDNEGVDEAHDPKNAEANSAAVVDKAAKTGPGQSKTRRADKRNPEKSHLTKAGKVKAAHELMTKMEKAEIDRLYDLLMAEGFDLDEEVQSEEIDFEEDLAAIMDDEATLSEEFKEKTAIIFEAALKSKLSEEIDRLEEQYQTELDEEINTIRTDLIEKVDGYLNYVVENWMKENELAIQQGVRTEVAENFMSKLRDLFEESYIEVPDSKIDLVDELAQTNEELEEQLNEAIGNAIELAEAVETLQRAAIIREASRDLAETQVERLFKLVESVEFEDEETFADKVETIKESYFKTKKTTNTINEDTDEDDDGDVEHSPTMSRYLEAIRKSSR